MDFRWIAGITLWTMLSGPVLIHWSTVIPRPSAPAPARVDLQPPLPSRAFDGSRTWATPVLLLEDF